VGPWSDPEVLRRIEGQSAVAAKALKRISAVPAVSGSEGPTQLVVLDELADGYHSPRYGSSGEGGRQLCYGTAACEGLQGAAAQGCDGSCCFTWQPASMVAVC
jgi:hypothetical protein